MELRERVALEEIRRGFGCHAEAEALEHNYVAGFPNGVDGQDRPVETRRQHRDVLNEPACHALPLEIRPYGESDQMDMLGVNLKLDRANHRVTESRYKARSELSASSLMGDSVTGWPVDGPESAERSIGNKPGRFHVGGPSLAHDKFIGSRHCCRRNGSGAQTAANSAAVGR